MIHGPFTQYILIDLSFFKIQTGPGEHVPPCITSDWHKEEIPWKYCFETTKTFPLAWERSLSDEKYHICV